MQPQALNRSAEIEITHVAVAPVPAWPNMHPAIHVPRWTDEQGRESHSSFQEIWYGPYQRAMKERLLEGAAASAR